MKNPYFDLIRAVWQNGQPWRKSIVAYYLAFIVAQGCLSLNPYAFGRTIDILQHFTPARFNEVIIWLSISVGVLVLFWVFHGPARVKEREIALKIQQSLRIRLYEQLTQLPLKWHQDHHSGNIITRINRASIALYRFAGDQFIYIETLVQLLTSIAFLLWISPIVGLFSIFTCVVIALLVYLFDRKMIPLYDAQNEIDNHVGAVVFDYISNMTTILTLRLAELTKTNLFKRMQAVWPIFRKDIVINELKWFSTGVLLAALQAFILIVYIVYNLKTMGAILIGTVVMIFRYQQNLIEVFFILSSHYSELVRMDTDVKGLQPLMDDIKSLTHTSQDPSSAKHWERISIENLHFHHAGHAQEKIFADFNLTIKRGEKIALIGASGGGKSTLLNLLRGLYTAEKVNLKIDTNAFSSLEPLQTITTLIPQDPELFENTILFNISLDVPFEQTEIDHIIKLAAFDKVLSKLPQGLETDIREKGLNLSVGQKQRLALARGLFAARYSSLILMDEPTSSVDLATENTILSNVMAAFPDSTVIVSLHRLHLLPKFDRIIMLNHGQILASGETNTVLAQPGPIRELWQSAQEIDKETRSP